MLNPPLNHNRTHTHTHTAGLQLNAAGHAVVGIDTFNSYYDVSIKRARAGVLAEHSVPYVAFGGCTDTENCGTQFALLCASRVVPGDVCDSELLKLMLQRYVRRCLHTWQSSLSPPPSHS